MEWWIWLLIGFVVWRAVSRGCAWRPRRLRGRGRGRLTRRDARRLEGSHRRGPELLSRRGRDRDGPPCGAREPSSPKPAEPEPRETPMERLQRRFTEGRISMEQYERELDELLGLSR